MISRRPTCLAAAFAGVAFASAARAGAQVRWDLGAQAGATQRVALPSTAASSPGPSGEIHAHVAVYPMLRVGPYALFDLSPTSGVGDRRIYAGGLRLKVTPPWLSVPWHAWGFLGVGFAYALTPGSASRGATSTTEPEVPLGLGLSHRLRGAWDVCAELGTRWNLGAIWASPHSGEDLLAVSLSLGVSFAP